MRPLTVLIAILLGSAVSITFSLTAALIVSALLSGAHPQLAAGLPHLLASLSWFAVLTAASAGSFLGQLRLRRWRRYAHLATAAILAAIALRYWPAAR
ncbi:MAG TPA: hypothetical protein VMV25_07360 [Steroidobacteraceae bacterium]|nr:hypothetical protein [Steroidobacteraceae bacterium]